MKVLKEVEISDSEAFEVIVKGMYQKEHEDFYRYSTDQCTFLDFQSWLASKYAEMTKYFKER